MNAHYSGFGHFSGFLHHFVLAKLATSSIRVYLHSGSIITITTVALIGQLEHCDSPGAQLLREFKPCSVFDSDWISGTLQLIIREVGRYLCS